MKPIINDILTAIIAAAVLAIFLFVIQAGVPLSIGAGVLAYIGGMLVFPKKKTQLTFVAEGITTDELSRILKEGRQKVASIQKVGNGITNVKVQSQVADICSLSTKIFEDIERDPKGIKSARKFLSYYLDTTAYIVNRYAELSAGVGYSDEVKTMLVKVEDTLTLIQETFVKQIGRLLQDDVDDLDIEVELLQKTIKMEGI